MDGEVKWMFDSALFSPCGAYRYVLTRNELGGEGKVVFVMLNPSTADAMQDDPTIRRCIRFAKTWGYNHLTVLNIFALRATDPRALFRSNNPVGHRNEAAFREILPGVDKVICAWGNYGIFRGQAVKANEWIEQCNHRPHALDITSKGMPKHPLYIPASKKPFPIGLMRDELRRTLGLARFVPLDA